MAISFAGPLASLILGGLIWLITLLPGYADPTVKHFVFIGLWVNVGWALLNLLPIYPLDGGQIFAAFMANKKPSIVPIVGMICAAGAAIYGLVFLNSIWMAFLFGLLAYENWQRSKGLSPKGFL